MRLPWGDEASFVNLQKENRVSWCNRRYERIGPSGGSDGRTETGLLCRYGGLKDKSDNQPSYQIDYCGTRSPT